MTQPWNEHPQMEPAEEQFIARLAEHYTPTPLTPTRRVELDETLWARVERRRGMKLVPALTAAAVGLLVAWLTFPGLFTPTPRAREPHLSVVETPSRGPWEYELIYPRELTGTSEGDDSTILPDDYRVIAQVFLDG